MAEPSTKYLRSVRKMEDKTGEVFRIGKRNQRLMVANIGKPQQVAFSY